MGEEGREGWEGKGGRERERERERDYAGYMSHIGTPVFHTLDMYKPHMWFYQ